MARKISKKLLKELKQLLIGLLLGDGTITNHPDFKMTHGEVQEEYLKWKISLLDKYNIPHGGFKEYTVKIATCVDEDTINIMINYFKNTYSLATCTKEDCINFLTIVKPYLLQVPSLLYKMRNNFTKEEFLALQNSGDFRSAEHLLV